VVLTAAYPPFAQYTLAPHVQGYDIRVACDVSIVSDFKVCMRGRQCIAWRGAGHG
jgi:hypothetical protein